MTPEEKSLMRHIVATLDELVRRSKPAQHADECRDILALTAALAQIYGPPTSPGTIATLKAEAEERCLQVALRSKEALGDEFDPAHDDGPGARLVQFL